MDFSFLKLETRIPKIGIVLTKKCGNAVVRNRIKRQVRVSFLKNVNRLTAGARILRFHRNPEELLPEVLKSAWRQWDAK